MVQPPFLYDAVRMGDFDPKAVSRASLAPIPPKPKKQDGPLISFNQHPDSYLILPYGNLNSKPMSPSVKSKIKWTRLIQSGLRCLELLVSLELMTMMILISGVDAVTGWVMRVVPGVAILHSIYAIYHLARRPSGRTPASAASYMLFASFADLSIVSLYAFSVLTIKKHPSSWKTILSQQEVVPTLSAMVYYLVIVGGGLFLISLCISLYLTVIFRKISQLPPDCNLLEDHLTSRHKHKTSTATDFTSSTMDKRLSAPFESTRGSGYEHLSRPPTLPFLHNRSNWSNDSFSTYKTMSPPTGTPSREAQHRGYRVNLPSRRYQITPDSPRSSIADLKRSSYYGSSAPTKQGSYTEIPFSDTSSQRTSRPVGRMAEAWYTSDSLNGYRSRSTPRKKGEYQPVELHDPLEEPKLSTASISEWLSEPASSTKGSIAPSVPNHIHPLACNPLTPRHKNFPSLFRDSPLSEIGNNRSSMDIADRCLTPEWNGKKTPQIDDFQAKYY